jgi:hypothetical protein
MRRISPRSILTAIGISVFLLTLVFVINNPNEIETLPLKCDCPTVIEPAPKIENPVVIKTEAPVIPKVETPTAPATVASTTSTQTPPLTFPPCQQVDKNSSVQRAIIIYYPHHQSEYFFPEIRWYVII